ncbi:MAG: hypothetical protein H0T46_27465 [Deltaproteobacteria bacterium]|nr:hypothetical protein [Deltaproteobacteria bacterium]
MNIRGLLFSVAVLAGCTKASAEQEAPARPPAPAVGPRWATPPPSKPVTPATARIELTAVTLADDCGGTAPATAPKAKSALKADSMGGGGAGARARRRCEQTSMQLSITAADASRIKVKSVELFDDNGKSLGKLAPRTPTRWSVDASMYQAWDETVPANSTSSVSYVLAQPDWDRIGNRWNRTYTLKTVVSIGGVDRTAQKEVMLSAPTSLPPNVKT